MNKNHLIYLLEYIAYKKMLPTNIQLIAWMEVNKKMFYNYQKSDIMYIMNNLGLGRFKKDLDLSRISKDYFLKVKVGNRYVNNDIFNEVLKCIINDKFKKELIKLYERL